MFKRLRLLISLSSDSPAARLADGMLPVDGNAEKSDPDRALVVSVDKAYELEFTIVNKVIADRLGYARQLVGFQLTAFAVTGTVIAAMLGKQFTVNPDVAEILCSGILWISFALQMELIVNATNIKALGAYVEEVLNKKYKTGHPGSELPIYEWHSFYGTRAHQASSVLRGLMLDAVSPSFILNCVMTAGAVWTFIISARTHLHTVKPFAVTVGSIGLLLNMWAFYHYCRFDRNAFVSMWSSKNR